jgi:hypothetical protein
MGRGRRGHGDGWNAAHAAVNDDADDVLGTGG